MSHALYVIPYTDIDTCFTSYSILHLICFKKKFVLNFSFGFLFLLFNSPLLHQSMVLFIRPEPKKLHIKVTHSCLQYDKKKENKIRLNELTDAYVLTKMFKHSNRIHNETSAKKGRNKTKSNELVISMSFTMHFCVSLIDYYIYTSYSTLLYFPSPSLPMRSNAMCIELHCLM